MLWGWSTHPWGDKWDFPRRKSGRAAAVLPRKPGGLADACGMGIGTPGWSGSGRLWLPSLTFAALALAGIWGSVAGVVELRQAVAWSQDLYRLDTVGSQMESDLEFQTQDSRRAFLSALACGQATASSDDPLASVNTAVEAAGKVRATIGRGAGLGPASTFATGPLGFRYVFVSIWPE
jgi:hypothetical protein